MTYDQILSHKLHKSNYFKATLQKCLQQEGWGGLGTLRTARWPGHRGTSGLGVGARKTPGGATGGTLKLP